MSDKPRRAPGSGHTKKTPEFCKNYLDKLYEENGFINIAAKKCGVRPCTIHEWRRKDEEFDTAVIETVALCHEEYTQRVLGRSDKGVKRDVYYQGQVVGQEVVHSDTLAIWNLNRIHGAPPQRHDHRIGGLPGAPPIQVKEIDSIDPSRLTDDEQQLLLQLLAKATTPPTEEVNREAAS